MSMHGYASQRASYTPVHLKAENRIFDGTRGVSANNREQGFLPAFLDTSTGRVFLSRFTSGEPAPVHLLDGLPNEVVLFRSLAGRITAVKSTVMAGFIRGERFYTREEAAQALA
jgi:hypothetical protein